MGQLKPTLGPVSGTLMMLNIVLGASLFILPGLAAQQTGPASVLFWLIAIVLATPLLIASYLFLGAVIWGLPAIALTAGFALGAGFGLSADISAMLILSLAIAANFLQTKRAGQLGSLACAMSLILMLVIIGLGFWLTPSSGLLNMENMAAGFSHRQWITGLSIIPLIFFAFTGWEVAISMGGEFKAPHRNLPIAIAVSFLIAATLYLLCALVIVHAGEATFNEAPFVHLLAPVLGVGASRFIALFIALLIWANLFAASWSVSRMIYSISQQGYLPAVLGHLSKHTPHYALIAFAIIGLFMLGMHALAFISVDKMLTLASVNFLVIYGLVCAAGIKKLPKRYQRIFSGCSIVTVGGVLVMAQSALFLAYPVLITLFAAIVFFLGQKDGLNK